MVEVCMRLLHETAWPPLSIGPPVDFASPLQPLLHAGETIRSGDANMIYTDNKKKVCT